MTRRSSPAHAANTPNDSPRTHPPKEPPMHRRDFLRAAAVCAAVPSLGRADARDEFTPARVISGKPRERGREYGRATRDGIKAFLDREIYGAFIQKPNPKDALL